MDMAEKNDTEERCPACRNPYNKEKIVRTAASCESCAMACHEAEQIEGVIDSSFKVSPEVERFLCDQLLDQTSRDSSNLLAHEAAFALGQMQDSNAIPALVSALNDLELHPIVRHEAAEALGAIDLESNVPLLKKSMILDPAQEVRETCELALSRIEDIKNEKGNNLPTTDSSPYLSVDPAAPASCRSVHHPRDTLLNEEKGVYERYAALFALHNHGGDDALSAILESLSANSALLRHEVAYVLGQLQNKRASDALSRILGDINEHPMVRHEAAEALGSIADEESILLLEEFCKDPEPIVSQSCEVALSMLEFERLGKSFEYLFIPVPQSEGAL